MVGQSGSAVHRYYMPSNSLKIDHWYDVVLHVYWSPDPTRAHVEWWLDGVKVFDIRNATLYLRSDGTRSYGYSFMFSNYRYWAGYPSSVDFDEAVVGPTATSVGFTP